MPPPGWHSLVLLFAVATTCSHAASFTFREGSFGSTCFTQPVPFGYYSFTYSMSISAQPQLVAGCSASQILITPVFMSGTCLQQPSASSSTACDSSVVDPIIVSGPTSTSGKSVSTADSSNICNQAVLQSQTSLASAETGTPFFSDTISCAPSTLGYFYIQNNCPPSTNESTIITILVGGYLLVTYGFLMHDVSGAKFLTIIPRSSWYSWGRWVTLAVVISSILIFSLLYIYLRRRRRLQAVNQVQMMPMPMSMPPPTQPPPGYYPGGQPQPYGPPAPAGSGPVTGYPVGPAGPGPAMGEPYGQYGKPPN